MILGTAWFLVPASLATLYAQNGAPLPTWRQGVSQWNGSGYVSPSDARITPASFLSATPSSAPAPYTVPVDPTSQARANPYFPASPAGSDARFERTPRVETSIPGSGLSSAGDLAFGAQDITSPPSGTTLATGAEAFGARAGQPVAASERAETTAWPQGVSTGTSREIDPAAADVEPGSSPSEVTRWYQYPRKWMHKLSHYRPFRFGRKEQ